MGSCFTKTVDWLWCMERGSPFGMGIGPVYSGWDIPLANRPWTLSPPNIMYLYNCKSGRKERERWRNQVNYKCTEAQSEREGK